MEERLLKIENSFLEIVCLWGILHINTENFETKGDEELLLKFLKMAVKSDQNCLSPP